MNDISKEEITDTMMHEVLHQMYVSDCDVNKYHPTLTEKMKYCVNNKNKIYKLRKKAFETIQNLTIEKYIADLSSEFITPSLAP